ncbi:GNAT family N-acetyltransferase [Erythrobacter rubeus]|uniref:GNAT family N-acetyltransferase n=1 Tax=Erythrobacter rubeus TaxID=2760803 RepID=A0ABR8KVQ1_9SPHN|nr:GNAT family N-acetyltransferase [Erythrobacter rubeus]MBD2843153.1 GNAT family N-acetyltransferase [Erythrobacter rubeus]
MTGIAIKQVDYADPGDAADLTDLLDYYARDPMGGGEPLSADAKKTLAAKMQDHPTAFSLIAYSDGVPAGLVNCFVGFSTFAAKPLVNIHDVVVKSEFRGRGIGKALFAEIEAIAAEKGACKVTLEVLSGNEPAKALYGSLGYGDYQLDPDKGHALFWQKELAA